VAEGLVAPLILEFETQVPIYPLALTATVGTRTEILLYTLSENKLSTGGRLPLRAAVQRASGQRPSHVAGNQPEPETQPAVPDTRDKSRMLCKFKGRLTAEQMREDLEFSVAPDDRPYRERKIVW
jgi:hypothetical protein